MALILVTHDAAAPALYGAIAAIVAAERGAGLAHLPARFDTARDPDAVQHAAASGVLVPSGLLWFERLTGRDVGAATTVGAVLRDAAGGDLVVPLHPAVMPAADLADVLRAGAGAAGIAIEHLSVREDGSRFAVRHLDAAAAIEHPQRWARDRYGRLVPVAAPATDLPDRGRPLRVGLIGAERDHRDVYPGALAALGDAAEAAGLNVDVVFVDPTAVRASDVAAAVAEVDGLLLPGGADMANVAGQILMARGALDRAVPAVGLCLGMQTMATALAQRALGGGGVNLAEADPGAAFHSFVAMAEEPSLVPHRLGECATVPVAGTRYGDLPNAPGRERFNHRFRLNPRLERPLATAGARVAARDATGMIVDAVEAGRHPFFIGLQGHPELRSRPGLPHPLLSAFVAAADRRAAARRDRRRQGASGPGARC